MTYNPEKHHRRSIRLKEYDYSSGGGYYLTIDSNNRECLFGEVTNKEMIPNEAGLVVRKCWLEIPSHYPNVVLDEFIVMPNHVHGIVFIVDESSMSKRSKRSVGAEYLQPCSKKNTVSGLSGNRVENIQPLHGSCSNTNADSVLPGKRVEGVQPKLNRFQKVIPGSIGSIVRGLKIGVTKWFRQNTDVYTVWQRNYYEHVIRNEQELNSIREYILNNPLRWELDREHPDEWVMG